MQMIPSNESITNTVRQLQSAGKKVVFTNGCFDILHPGHIDLLRKARALGDVLLVAINSDVSVSRIKGPHRPIFNQEERAELLAALEMVDLVTVFNEETPLQAILDIRPDVLIKGADWGLDNIVGRREVESWGGRVATVSLTEGQSTTGIVERVLARHRAT
jgi:rfaE bifunctional protein nucleotidyltransferase chain/domain